MVHCTKGIVKRVMEKNTVIELYTTEKATNK